MTEKTIFGGYNRKAAREQLGKDIEILYRRCKCSHSAADIAREAGISPNTIKDIRDVITSVKLDTCFALLEYLAKEQGCTQEDVLAIHVRYSKALII